MDYNTYNLCDIVGRGHLRKLRVMGCRFKSFYIQEKMYNLVSYFSYLKYIYTDIYIYIISIKPNPYLPWAGGSQIINPSSVKLVQATQDVTQGGFGISLNCDKPDLSPSLSYETCET